MFMNKLKNKKGIALVTALCFTLISLGIVMMLLYVVTQGTKVTSAHKRYKTSLEAGFGAVELLQKDIIPKMMNLNSTDIAPLATQFAALSMSIPIPGCLAQKINFTSWDSSCTASNKTAIASDSPDMSFNLKALNDTAGYNVYTKIVDTRCGGTSSDPCSNGDPNSGGLSGIDKGGTGMTGDKYTVGKPAFYRIEVTGERATNQREKSELSVLYAY
jgi:hypothetical protein